MDAEPFTLVLAEDDDGHARLVERNLKRAGLVNDILRVCDGQAALDCLHGRGIFAGRKRRGPLLLLLDINMPCVDGIEVLRQIKADRQTESIPVIILTTTDDPREIEHCYRLGCSVYVTKPVAYEAFIEAIRRLGLFLQIVNVPDVAQQPAR
jgi:CheY-like chemotaxis protein